jgi:hypothetical protein
MSSRIHRIICLMGVSLTAGATLGADVPASGPASSQAAVAPPAASGCAWPDLSWPTLTWFGAVATLALTFRPKPLFTARNLDALVLAGACILLGLRDVTTPACSGPRTWQWWGYAGLTAAAVYWLLRGVALLASNKRVAHAGPVSAGAQVVLLIVGLGLAIHQLAAAPVSAASRDGLVGGLYTAATKKLPYGDVPGYDHRSPLLYIVHSAAARIVDATSTLSDGAGPLTMTWDNREQWLNAATLADADLTPARLVNAALFVLTLLGLCVIGRRLRTDGGVGLLVTLFCIFPGTLECLPRPEIMLPVCLLTWTLAFALLPVFSGLLSPICLVLAGAAWPWAWLGLPILMAHFWRRGWQTLWSTVSLAGGAAACAFALLHCVQPTLPAESGALAMAGRSPNFDVRVVGADTLSIDRRSNPTSAPAGVLSRWLWTTLLKREETVVDDASDAGDTLRLSWPNGVSGSSVGYHDLGASPEARPLLQRAYRRAVAELAESRRLCAGLRTVLEATWPLAGAIEPVRTGAWSFWSQDSTLESRVHLARRVTKGIVALLVIWATLVVFFGRRTQPRHLLGALLMTCSGMLLAGAGGAVGDWVWLLPLIAPLWVLHEPEAPRPVPQTAHLPPLGPPGEPPRISFDAQPPGN